MHLYPPLFRPLALSAFLLITSQAPAGYSLITLAHAETSISVNAQGLLRGLHRSLAAIVVAYNQRPPSQRSRADALMLDGARAAATELGRLKTAIADRNAGRIATSVRRMSEAVGRLQGTYRMASVRNSTVAEGMRALEANWAAFTAHYALPRSNRVPKTVGQAQLNELKDRVSSLESELRHRRAKVSDPAVLRELDHVYLEVERIDRRPITIESYQSTLLSLSFLTGAMTGYAAVSAIYYPNFHDYWAEEADRSSFYYQDHWDAYYQGYYDGSADQFESSFDVPETVYVNVDQTLGQQVDIYAQQEVDVLADQAENSAAEYSHLPVEAADVAGESAPLAIDDPVAAAEHMTDSAHPDSEEPAATQPDEEVAAPPAGTDADADKIPFGDDGGSQATDGAKAGGEAQGSGESEQDEPHEPGAPALDEQNPDDIQQSDQPLPENEQPSIEDQPAKQHSTEEAPSGQEIETERPAEPTATDQGDTPQESGDEDPNPRRKLNR